MAARFQIFKCQDDEFKDNSFELDVHSGEVQPKETQKVRVTYKP